MRLEALPIFIYPREVTYHFMPYQWEMLVDLSLNELKDCIVDAFSEHIPTIVKHNYEKLKTAETVGIKRKRPL